MPLEIYLRGRIYHVRGTVAGRLIRRSLKISDRNLAEHAANQLEAKILRESVFGKEAEFTFADACVRYFQDHPAAQGGRIGKLLAPAIREIGRAKLRALTPGHIKALARKLHPQWKGQSLNSHVIAPVSAVINHAHQFGLCNPIRVRRFAERDVRIARAIDREWIDAFMRHAPERVAAFALFCFTTGSRPLEACGLRPEHLHLNDGIAIGDATKNGQRRIYELIPEMVSRLRTLEPRKVTRGPNKGELRVFGYGCQGCFSRIWKQTCEVAGIEFRTFYEAGRHSHFTETVVRNGADVVTAGKLGNCTPQVLLRRYAHADAPEKLASRVFGSGTKSAQQNRKKLKVASKSSG